MSEASISRGSVTRAEVETSLTKIYYYLKEKTTKKVYTGEQNIGDMGGVFGEISLWLPAGNYEIFVFGYGVNNPKGSVTIHLNKSTGAPNITHKDKDSFYLKMERYISVEDSHIDVNLTRLNSMLVIKLNDDVPSDIETIKANMSYYPVYESDTEKVTYISTSDNYSKMESSLVIKNGRVEEFGFYVLPQNVKLHLSVYDINNKELGLTTIPISLYKNRKTIVEGNLFDVITQKPFNVTISDEWGENVIVPIG